MSGASTSLPSALESMSNLLVESLEKWRISTVKMRKARENLKLRRLNKRR
jgi:hypothetical protein